MYINRSRRDHKFVFAMQSKVRAKELEKMYFIVAWIKAELVKVH